jgi:hypothetical protein
MRQLYTKKKANNKGFLLIAVMVIIIFVIFQKFNQSSFFNKANTNDNIVAQVNGENIYQTEVEKKYKALLSVVDNINLSNLPASVLEILIRDVYIDKKILSEIQNSSIINMAQIEEQVNNFKTKLIRTSYLDSLTKNSIDEQKIVDKFNEINKQFDAKNQYYFQQIVLTSQEEAENVYKQIFAKKKALKFIDALKKYSKDRDSFSGSENFIAEDKIKSEIIAVLNVLKEQEISRPFLSGEEWLIVKKIALKIPEKLELADYKEKIKQVLLKDEIEKVIGNLVKDANIKILIPTKQEEKSIEEKMTDETSTNQKSVDEKSSSEIAIEEKAEANNITEEQSTEIDNSKSENQIPQNLQSENQKAQPSQKENNSN